MPVRTGAFEREDGVDGDVRRTTEGLADDVDDGPRLVEEVAGGMALDRTVFAVGAAEEARSSDLALLCPGRGGSVDCLAALEHAVSMPAILGRVEWRWCRVVAIECSFRRAIGRVGTRPIGGCCSGTAG